MAVVVGWRPPIAERMLQAGLRDILSSIVGRIAALGHALAAHDIALGRSHGSRAWAAWKRTWGFGHHGKDRWI